VRSTDPVVLVLNLGLLLGASLIPWPTALISKAIGESNRSDAIAAVVVFAVVSCVHSFSWLGLDLYLARHLELLESPSDARWMRRHAQYSAGAIVVVLAGIGVAFVSPVATLVLYLLGVGVFLVSRLVERRPRV
jgi:uncharacterized membrane protein